jgi:ABC-2 type transport system permease protein
VLTRRSNPGFLAPGWAIVKAYLQDTLVYRFDLLIGLARVLILIGVFHYFWLALYGGRADYAGVPINQALTYAALSLIINPLFSNSLVMEVGGRIRSGNVLFDVTRPVNYGDLLLYQTAGKAAVRLLTTTLPLFALTYLLVGIDMPAAPAMWLAFLASLGLSFLIAYYIDYLAALAGFWFTETSGIRFAKWSLTDLLAGVYLPLWVFPGWLQHTALALPFRGINFTPVAIFVGYFAPDRVPLELAFQAAWVIALVLLSRLVYRRAQKTLAVQGG